MTTCKRGDIVLVDYEFMQRKGSKRRPALVLSDRAYHASRREVIVAAITSNTALLRVGDTKLRQWKDEGLLFPSVVTGILRTMRREAIVRKIGRLAIEDFERVEAAISTALGLDR